MLKSLRVLKSGVYLLWIPLDKSISTPPGQKKATKSKTFLSSSFSILSNLIPWMSSFLVRPNLLQVFEYFFDMEHLHSVEK
ncbi:hypothetical protein M5K25_000587 [Dendrobium thyrsiflorum]|uniref:Uncharacterized protein n=1 Tax=Dendrobium thyrsiflorum TaxID=117978 RepID=A0ABD0W828_DENTH